MSQPAEGPTLMRVRGKKDNRRRRRAANNSVYLQYREESAGTDSLRSSSPPSSSSASSLARPPRRRLSLLEQLPTEIAQDVFLLSGNTNLALVSPTLSRQLCSQYLRDRLLVGLFSDDAWGSYDDGHDGGEGEILGMSQMGVLRQAWLDVSYLKRAQAASYARKARRCVRRFFHGAPEDMLVEALADLDAYLDRHHHQHDHSPDDGSSSRHSSRNPIVGVVSFDTLCYGRPGGDILHVKCPITDDRDSCQTLLSGRLEVTTYEDITGSSGDDDGDDGDDGENNEADNTALDHRSRSPASKKPLPGKTGKRGEWVRQPSGADDPLMFLLMSCWEKRESRTRFPRFWRCAVPEALLCGPWDPRKRELLVVLARLDVLRLDVLDTSAYEVASRGLLDAINEWAPEVVWTLIGRRDLLGIGSSLFISTSPSPPHPSLSQDENHHNHHHHHQHHSTVTTDPVTLDTLFAGKAACLDDREFWDISLPGTGLHTACKRSMVFPTEEHIFASLEAATAGRDPGLVVFRWLVPIALCHRSVDPDTFRRWFWVRKAKAAFVSAGTHEDTDRVPPSSSSSSSSLSAEEVARVEDLALHFFDYVRVRWREACYEEDFL